MDIQTKRLPSFASSRHSCWACRKLQFNRYTAKMLQIWQKYFIWGHLYPTPWAIMVIFIILE